VHRGGTDHCGESQRFRAAFPDNKIEHPYDILFGDLEHAAFVGPFTATFTDPLESSDGPVIAPIGNALDAVVSTIARRRGRIVEEYLKYENARFIQQIGIAT
jgi:hypothetical protein